MVGLWSPNQLTKEGGQASGGDDGAEVALFDGGTRKDLVARILVYGQRFTRQCGLVNFDVAVFALENGCI